MDDNLQKVADLVEYRLKILETQYAEMKIDIKSIAEVVNRLDRKFANVPPEGLQCNLHALRMDAFRKELDDHNVIIKDLQTFKWKAVGVLSVVMLLVQLLGTTIFDKAVGKTFPQSIKIELAAPWVSTNQFHTLDENGNLVR